MATDQLGDIKISNVFGPVAGKLQIGDKLIMVQDNSCVGMTLADCVNLTKSADKTISISVAQGWEVT